MWFNFTKAVVRKISKSFAEEALKLEEPAEAIDLTKAQEQWRGYVETLKKLGLEIIEIEADDSFPDCVFIEDPAVVCDDIALITRPGHNSRRGESKAVRDTLQALGLKIVDMCEPGLMDGGDVLFTGKEFFVGLTSRTNEQGAESLAKAMPGYPVTCIDMRQQGNTLHLKSCMSMAGPQMIAVGQSEAAEDAWKIIEEQGKYQYNKLSVPEDKAANALYINGTLVHQAASFIPHSIKVFRMSNCCKIEVDLSELSKADGCLTCCALLIK